MVVVIVAMVEKRSLSAAEDAVSAYPYDGLAEGIISRSVYSKVVYAR